MTNVFVTISDFTERSQIDEGSDSFPLNCRVDFSTQGVDGID